MEECIKKQKLDIILLVDASKSMGGPRITQVDQAIHEIKSFLIDLQSESSNVDFYISIIPKCSSLVKSYWLALTNTNGRKL